MDVAVVIFEQLDADGTLRTLRMQARSGEQLIVAFAHEYEEIRSGPFHFLNDQHEARFQRDFAECKSRRLSSSRFYKLDSGFHFNTSWEGIPTKKYRLSYYALCLPQHAIPLKVRFFDPRSGREYKKTVVRDDQRERFVLYLECRSSHSAFDFSLETDFRISQDEFLQTEFRDETTSPDGAYVDIYECLLPQEDRVVVNNFFTKEMFVRDQYNVTGQVGAVGPNATSKNNTFSQTFQQALSDINLSELATELSALRKSMRQEATEIEHDKAIACIGSAEGAAKDRDGAGALNHLKSAGKWAFDVANKIGTTVAAKAIETAMGL
jgi:hypothetical protein